MSAVPQQSPLGQLSSLPGEDAFLVEHYRAVGVPLDDLPYTPDFDQIRRDYADRFGAITERELFHRLLRLRKAARLPRVGRIALRPLGANADDVDVLENLVEKYAGTLGQRDRLPYTAEFEQLVREFNHRSLCAPLSPHEIWRLVCRMAK